MDESVGGGVAAVVAERVDGADAGGGVGGCPVGGVGVGGGGVAVGVDEGEDGSVRVGDVIVVLAAGAEGVECSCGGAGVGGLGSCGVGGGDAFGPAGLQGCGPGLGEPGLAGAAVGVELALVWLSPSIERVGKVYGWFEESVFGGV